MRRVRVIEFDSVGRLVSMTEARTAEFASDDAWLLRDVARDEYCRGRPWLLH